MSDDDFSARHQTLRDGKWVPLSFDEMRLLQDGEKWRFRVRAADPGDSEKFQWMTFTMQGDVAIGPEITDFVEEN